MSVLLLLSLPGCLGTTQYEADEDALGPEAPGVSPGPLHRPGQPCLTCHREEHSPGDEVYVLAGTTYLEREGDVGLENVRVSVRDSGGHSFEVASNAAGNFFVKENPEDGGRLARPQGDGGVVVPYRLVFPLRVIVSHPMGVQSMEASIEREGSCAFCHLERPGAASNGRVYVMEPP